MAVQTLARAEFGFTEA